MADDLDFDDEELIARMTDEELLGLTPENSRPGTGDGKRSGLSALVLSRPSSGASTGADGKPRQLAQSASAPVVGTLRPSSCSEVKAQRKEAFHFKRQRRWLEIRNKQHCLTFTEQEISDFQRFFDALSKGKEVMPLDRFEDMLVCLGLAKSRKDIRHYREAFTLNFVNNEVRFADFLSSMERNLDSETMDVLKLLLQGTYDVRDLDYPTFISERRRKLILTATGARGSAAQLRSFQIVRTFSDLLEDRCYHDFGNGAEKPSEDGVLLMGGLGTMWKVACTQDRKSVV